MLRQSNMVYYVKRIPLEINLNNTKIHHKIIVYWFISFNLCLIIICINQTTILNVLIKTTKFLHPKSGGKY